MAQREIMKIRIYLIKIKPSFETYKNKHTLYSLKRV